jgi:nucleotide-binding universal stress UspA family protein
MKKILFPTDFSENSEHALPFALELARLFQCEITLFNSYKLPHSKSNLMVSMQDRMKKDSEQELNSIKTKIAGIEKSTELVIGSEARSGGFVSLIPKMANRCDTNLIVMGTKGASGLKEMFIGSNTLEVIQTTQCPVLAVPENAKLKKLERISFATDFREIMNPNQLNPLFDIARKTNSPIEFVFVMRNEDGDFNEQKAKQAIELESLAEGIKTSIFIISNNDIIEGMSEYINKVKPDLLSMMSRKHNLFERLFTSSITSKLSFRTEIPLLVLDE